MTDTFEKLKPQPEVSQEQPVRPDQGERLASPDVGFDRERTHEGITEQEAITTKEASESVSGTISSDESTQTVPSKSQTEQQVEHIMEEGLGDIYASMTTEKQEEFKAAGERTASKISALLSETKVKVKKIVELLRDWLKLIPGVNKYFLDQEAKLKADKIIDIQEDQDSSDASHQNTI